MSTHFLPVYRSNATFDLEEMLPVVLSHNADLEFILRFCQSYRIRGICSLFLDGRPGELLMDLHRSGMAFSHFLQISDVSGKATSKAAPLFDAIASGGFWCAREIAQNSRLTWNENEEYEDDFQYVLFLIKHFFLNGTPEECADILRRFEEVQEGATDPRMDICRSFMTNNPDQFHGALGGLLEMHESRYQRLVSTDAILPEEAATEGKLCIEGLALVRLAEGRGFPLEEDYLFIPSTVRERLDVTFSADDWQYP